MLIYVCVSSHGYGHAARQAAVLAQLHRCHPDWMLVISSMVDEGFLALVLQNLPVIRRRVRWDVGMLQADALGSDREATLLALQVLEASLLRQLDAEEAWIRSHNSEVIVIGDVPPAAAALADRLDAPLIWVGNFGWDDIYSPLGDAFLPWAQKAAAAYRRGSLLLRCPFSMAMLWSLPERQLTLVAGTPNALPGGLQDRLREDPRGKVLVGFGGLGLTLDTRLYGFWPQHLFLLATPQESRHLPELRSLDNVLLLPSGVRPLDVMPFCDRHLGKPGFSSFCEAMACGLGLHVVRRHGFAEADVLMEGLRAHSAHRILSRECLDSGDWQLDQPLVPASGQPLSSSGAEQAADAVQSVAEPLVKKS